MTSFSNNIKVAYSPQELRSERSDALVQQWISMFPSNSISDCIDNANGTACAICSDQHALPMLIPNPTHTDPTWVTSLHTHYIRYARDELEKISSPPLQILLTAIVSLLEKGARRADIDQIVYLNNFGISTNIWPQIPNEFITDATKHCTKKFPNKAIVLRSLNERTEPDLLATLRRTGFILIPSRITYCVSAKEPPNTKSFKQDNRLFHDGHYQLRSADTLSDAELRRCRQLYQQLYLRKYNPFNPQYTEHFFQHSLQSNFLSFSVLEKNGIIDGVIGTLRSQKTLTCPILGYDLSRPRSAGLYRRLAMAIYLDAVKKQCELVNRSSGVGRFKRARGATPSIEYTAVYCAHRPARVKRFWKALAGICTHLAVPLIKKQEL